jgi:2,3-bisphosphoglycerate-independent phosphoglycerate mutase
METLQKFKKFTKRPGPLLLIIMDGIGLNDRVIGNAVVAANKPILDDLMKNRPMFRLKAHGTAVGLPSDADMGNSEVGHNAIGAGRVFEQGARLVNGSIESGSLWAGEIWKKLIRNAQSNSGMLHFIGLFSDGNVHSHLDHLKAMIQRAKQEGIQTVRIHILLDGRDVGETSALEYVMPFEAFLSEINQSGTDYAIASGGGRMLVTMDRYEADWSIVECPCSWCCREISVGRTGYKNNPRASARHNRSISARFCHRKKRKTHRSYSGWRFCYFL